MIKINRLSYSKNWYGFSLATDGLSPHKHNITAMVWVKLEDRDNGERELNPVINVEYVEGGEPETNVNITGMDLEEYRTRAKPIEECGKEYGNNMGLACFDSRGFYSNFLSIKAPLLFNKAVVLPVNGILKAITADIIGEGPFKAAEDTLKPFSEIASLGEKSKIKARSNDTDHILPDTWVTLYRNQPTFVKQAMRSALLMKYMEINYSEAPRPVETEEQQS